MKASHEYHLEEVRRNHLKELEDNQKFQKAEIERLKKKHANKLEEHTKQVIINSDSK